MSHRTADSRIARILRRFVRREDGALTWFGLYMFVAMCLVGGIALDVAYLITARSQLQVAADIATHAALFNRDRDDADTAKQKALAMAQNAMPPWFYGDVITEDDIKFGTYDAASFTFTESATSREAAMIEAFRVSDRSNTVASFLLRFIGKDDWDMVVPSVFETFRPTCLREGFVADGVVDIQSNNSYTNGFCIHSNTHVSVNQNNYWEPGTIVSMPNLGDLEMPRSGFTRNEGLEQALRNGKYRMHVINRLDDIVAGMTDPNSRYYRSFLINPTPRVVTRKNQMAVADFSSQRVNVINCGNQGVTLAAERFQDMVIIGYGCDFSLRNGFELVNATLISTSTDDRSIDSPQGATFGLDDNCASGGGAQVITYGGFRVAAGLEMYGSQIIAAGPISFAANADGIEGASMVSGETIDGTSNMSFGFCGTGMDSIFEAEYFRMRG